MLKKIVIASTNPGKLREIGTMLEHLGIEAIAQSAFDVPESAEPHATFVENALAKARHAARWSGLAALADDSGICVDVLAGAPGVRSARLAGEPRSDERNNRCLLQLLSAHDNRTAHYYCVMVLVMHAEDPEPLIAEGHWRGEILRVPRGTRGFGYDPLFLDLQLNRSAAELSAAQKNRISHRGKALAALRRALQHRGR